jgi:hypothetical protein
MPTTPKRGHKQAHDRKTPDQLFDALAVCDGAITVGFIVERAGEHFAHDLAGRLIGRFPTQTEAMRAIPKAALCEFLDNTKPKARAGRAAP